MENDKQIKDIIDSIETKIIADLASNIEKKIEELVSKRFKEETGEELTPDQYHRIQILIPYYEKREDKRRIWTIDEKYVLEIYETDIDWSMTEPYKVKTSLKYREL